VAEGTLPQGRMQVSYWRTKLGQQHWLWPLIPGLLLSVVIEGATLPLNNNKAPMVAPSAAMQTIDPATLTPVPPPVADNPDYTPPPPQTTPPPSAPDRESPLLDIVRELVKGGLPPPGAGIPPNSESPPSREPPVPNARPEFEVQSHSQAPVAVIAPEVLEVFLGQKARFESRSRHDPRLQLSQHWIGPTGQRASGGEFVVNTHGLRLADYRVVLEIADSRRREDQTTAVLRILPPKLSLKATPRQVKIGDPVTLIARTSFKDADYRYRFIFGGGENSPPLANPIIRHTFQQAGDFRVYAELLRQGKLLAKSQDISIQVRPDYQIQLRADRTHATVGEAVAFQGAIEPLANGVAFRFNYGDGRGSPPGSQAHSEHIYTHPGTYQVMLSARIGDLKLKSQALEVNVEALAAAIDPQAGLPPPAAGVTTNGWEWPWWLSWLAFGGGGMVIGALIQRLAQRGGRPPLGANFKVRPLLDKGKQLLDGDLKEEELISVRLRPVIDSGTQTLQMEEKDDEQV